MSLVINTNVGALNAQRQLVSSGSELSQAMERLSSGRRINSAADDAAGLAISNRQTSQIRGLDQAIRNANDGVSLIQTAEGALDESTNILQRMRELSIQSANGIYSDADRATLDAEFQQLIEELDRIAETTSFNGQNLLDGTLGDVALHIGSEADQIIDFSIQGMSTSDLGLGATSSDLNGGRVETGIGSSIGEGDVLINNQALSAITDLGGTGTDDTTLFDVIDDINTNIEGVSASGYNIVAAESAGSGIISASETLRLTLGSVDDQAEVVYDITNTESMDDLVDTINQITGGNITAAVDDNGKLSLSNVTGGTMTVSYDDASPYVAAEASATGDAAIETITGISIGADGDGTESFNGSIALTADDGSTITITRGAGGTSADLSVLGFPEVVGAGEVLGVSLDSDGQNNPLASGDLIINGTNIGAIPEDEGLQAKLDAINALSDETGVTATSLAIDALTTKTTGDYTELTATAGSFPAGDININGVNVATTGTSVESTVTEINAATANTGVSAFVDNAGSIHLFSEGQITLSDGGGGAVTEFGAFTDLAGASPGVVSGTTYLASTPSAAGSVSINGTNVPLTDISSVDMMVAEINAASGSTGVRALIDDNGELQLSSPSRINVQLGSTDNALTSLSALGITLTDVAMTPTLDDLSDDVYIIDPAIKLDSANDATISIEVTADGTDATGLQSLNTDLSSTIVGSALASLSIGTAEGANAAIGSIDQALETINATRSDLGAINNRLEFTMSNLSNISENTSAARSRIVDADFAAESANLSRAQVLQQASQAMLAQANAQPQQVLQLLQG